MSQSPTFSPSPQSGQSVPEAAHIRDLTPQQWKSGVAAWLGWLFDGLDSYLYVLVAAVFVQELLHAKSPGDPAVKQHAAYIQAAFLVGWATGGAVFGWIGDRVGRSRTISLTILTYALCTGLACFAWNWESLLVFRFLAALGIGGEWAAGSALISETWPRRWRPWVSACLQSAYQGGILLASLTTLLLAHQSPRYVFIIGALPALIVFWMRKAIPEPDEWHEAKAAAKAAKSGTGTAMAAQPAAPGIADLFRGDVLRITLLTICVCSVALTTVWAFLFWFPQHLRGLPDVKGWSDAAKTQWISRVTMGAMVTAIFGNFFANVLARRLGYRIATSAMFVGGLITLYGAYCVPRDHVAILYWVMPAHFFVQGIFGLFPMYVPPLFPTLLRTTGAGFCYNFGRLVAALGTVLFATTAPGFDVRTALLHLSYVFIPGIIIALLLPEPTSESPAAVLPAVTPPARTIDVGTVLVE